MGSAFDALGIGWPYIWQTLFRFGQFLPANADGPKQSSVCGVFQVDSTLALNWNFFDPFRCVALAALGPRFRGKSERKVLPSTSGSAFLQLGAARISIHLLLFCVDFELPLLPINLYHLLLKPIQLMHSKKKDKLAVCYVHLNLTYWSLRISAPPPIHQMFTLSSLGVPTYEYLCILHSTHRFARLSLRARWRVTVPLLMFLKIEIASLQQQSFIHCNRFVRFRLTEESVLAPYLCDIPCSAIPFTERISSPDQKSQHLFSSDVFHMIWSLVKYLLPLSHNQQ